MSRVGFGLLIPMPLIDETSPAGRPHRRAGLCCVTRDPCSTPFFGQSDAPPTMLGTATPPEREDAVTQACPDTSPRAHAATRGRRRLPGGHGLDDRRFPGWDQIRKISGSGYCQPYSEPLGPFRIAGLSKKTALYWNYRRGANGLRPRRTC